MLYLQNDSFIYHINYFIFNILFIIYLFTIKFKTMQQTKEQQQEFNYKSPAFPPQVAQDNFGRIFAAIPGMSKLEFFALQLLPTYIEISRDKPLRSMGVPVNCVQASIQMAKDLINACNEYQQEQEPGNVISMDIK